MNYNIWYGDEIFSKVSEIILRAVVPGTTAFRISGICHKAIQGAVYYI